MKIRKVKIGIKSVKDVLQDVSAKVKSIEDGERLKPVKGPEIYFASFEVFRKALTPKRLELLHVIKEQKPSSINELARMAKRDIKNISDDVKALQKIGLIEIVEDKKKTAPVIRYDRIELDIAV